MYYANAICRAREAERERERSRVEALQNYFRFFPSGRRARCTWNTRLNVMVCMHEWLINFQQLGKAIVKRIGCINI